MRCTYQLTEREPAVCRLAPADVDFLLAEHRAHVELTPTGRGDCYRLTPTGYVGTILTPGCRLLLRPKIPVTNLFYLLDPSAVTAAVDDATTPESGDALLDFLAARLASLMTERAAAGLHRAYVERREQAPQLRGRLDLAAQLRVANASRHRLHCAYEDFTADVLCNQLVRSAAEAVAGSPLLSEAVRTVLGRALDSFAGVQPVRLEADNFRELVLNRQTEPYRPLLDLCRLLVEGLKPSSRAGSWTCPTFLLDMERVFEQYVTRGLVAAGQVDCSVEVQPLCALTRLVAGQPGLSIRPDLLVRCGDNSCRVIDVKWRDISNSAPRTDDLYQVVTYATGLGAEKAILVYPGWRDRTARYPLARWPLVVEVRTLRVVGSREACRRALERLCRALLGIPRARKVH